MAAEDAENPSNSLKQKQDEQVIQDMIQMRKHQLDALNKIMSSINKPSENNPMVVNERTFSNGHKRHQKKNKA